MIPFKQALHFTRSNRKSVDWVVIHSAEVSEAVGAANALMERCAVSDRLASWHYAVDNAGCTQSVLEHDVAWHAPGANKKGIGVELCQRANQTELQWADEYSSSVIVHAAKLIAGICDRQEIPVRFVPADGLLRGVRGITTHAEASKAFKKSNHTDPGPNFPLQRFLDFTYQYSAKRRDNA